jgi:hypothetical protein
MIVDSNGESTSDSARLTLPLPIFELDLIELEEKWDDEIWFEEHNRLMAENAARGITF